MAHAATATRTTLPATAGHQRDRQGHLQQDRRPDLTALADAIERVARPVPADAAPTFEPWPGLRLERGGVHEWFGVTDRPDAADAPACADGGQTHTSPHTSQPTSDWTPPLAVLVHLARAASAPQSTDADARAKPGPPPGGDGGPASGSRLVIWIGRAVWPHPQALASTAIDAETEAEDQAALTVTANAPLVQSVFVDPPDDATRLWAMELALRSPAVAAVVVDGRRLTMAHTRRLQLAAASGAATALVARPMRERGCISAARSRWLVHRVPASGVRPRWQVELLHRKAHQQSQLHAVDHRTRHDAPSSARVHMRASLAPPDGQIDRQIDRRPACAPWSTGVLEWDHATSGIRLLPELGRHAPHRRTDRASSTSDRTRPDTDVGGVRMRRAESSHGRTYDCDLPGGQRASTSNRRVGAA